MQFNNENHKIESHRGELIVYQSDDGQIRLDVRLEDETVWLTQPMMAELFQTTQQNISQHVIRVYEEGELEQEATHKKFLSVRQEGNRQVQRNLDYYNLDMIISVGYRVKSAVATRFRIWATERLKEHIVKGFTMDARRLKEEGGSRYFEELLARLLAERCQTPLWRIESWLSNSSSYQNQFDAAAGKASQTYQFFGIKWVPNSSWSTGL